jgi:hypothetical protein
VGCAEDTPLSRRNVWETREEADPMKVTNVRGLLVATIALDSRDFGEISNLSDAELVLRAKQAVSTVIPAHLIRDILVGRDGDVLEVALTM